MVRDRFPSPYTIEDAEHWVRHCVRALPATDFAIDVDGEASGGIGIVLRDDIERISAELGLLAGRDGVGPRRDDRRSVGVCAVGVRALQPAAHLSRTCSNATRPPRGCSRKPGSLAEARLRRAVIKEGQVLDEWLFARVVDDPAPRSA